MFDDDNLRAVLKRGVTRAPRYTKFAVPPDSLMSEVHAYGVSLRLSWTFCDTSSALSAAI